MTNSYLGVITNRGLERLVVESQHAAPFLMRHCYRRRPYQSCCCWATLDKQDAQIIRQLIDLGLHAQALWRLNADALYLGRLYPTDATHDAA